MKIQYDLRSAALLRSGGATPSSSLRIRKGSTLDWWLNLGFLPLDQMVPLAQAAERSGFVGVSLPDHLVFPELRSSAYPYSRDGSVIWPAEAPWPDPWVAISAMAQTTSRLAFNTGVQILPLREPLALAKAISTAWAVSGGRLECGFGAGWLAEEYDAVGVDFDTRGRRMDEMLEILPGLWSGEPFAYSGSHFAFESLRMCPPAVGIPILIGGNTRPAMRRAARHDGWIGAHTSLEESGALLGRLEAILRETGKTKEDFRVYLTGTRPDPAGVRALARSGLDAFIIPASALTRSEDPAARIEAIEAFDTTT